MSRAGLIKKALSYAAGLTLASWLVIRVGIAIGQAWVDPGEGLSGRPDLFRFDSEYYLSIAVDGYSYNGMPYSSPNIVFAPAFSMAVRSFAWTGVDLITAGFALNKVFLFLAFFLLYIYFLDELGERRTVLTLLAMGTTAGSYSFHAFYSESLMFFLLALLLCSFKFKNWLTGAAAAGFLGATRVAAFPIAAVTSVYFALRALRARRDSESPFAFWCFSVISVAGLASYLLFIGLEFGNPFVIFPEIQSASWAFFHPKVPVYFLFGPNLVQFALNAVNRGVETFTNIMSINLFWTLLAFGSVIHGIRQKGLNFFNLIFAAYFLFTYFTGAGSEFLISTHRFYVLMIPIFLMFGDLHGWIKAKTSKTVAIAATGLLILANLFYCLLHTAYFNQGVWFFF